MKPLSRFKMCFFFVDCSQQMENSTSNLDTDKWNQIKHVQNWITLAWTDTKWWLQLGFKTNSTKNDYLYIWLWKLLDNTDGGFLDI